MGCVYEFDTVIYVGLIFYFELFFLFPYALFLEKSFAKLK